MGIANGKVYWVGDVDNCDICTVSMANKFVDGKTIYGSWATMCQSCHKRIGMGFGAGKGQLYEKQSDNRWLKIRG